MKVAIVGTGISGLVVAHRLHATCDLTLFEAGSHIGGHTRTIDVEVDGQAAAIDTGFVVYNEKTYPRFVELLRELEVESSPTSMSFSVRAQHRGTLRPRQRLLLPLSRSVDDVLLRHL